MIPNPTTTALEEVMSTDPFTLFPDDTIEQALYLMVTHQIDHLPVISGDEVVGIVSKSDLYEKFLYLTRNTGGKTFGELQITHTPVTDVMTPNPQCLTIKDTVADAASILLDGNFHACPIVDSENRIVGIVTSGDIMRFYVASR